MRDRREIRSFFIQAVDRDKIVLAGSALDSDFGGGALVSPRSAEFIDQARDRARLVKEVLVSGHREGAVSAAYYSMLYAARAALSEHDEHARTHRGTWKLFRERYVVTDAFDDSLYTLCQHAQIAREGA